MGELRRWVVTGTSMVVEAEDWEEAIDRAQETSGWQWEAEEWVDPVPHPVHTECADGCGLDVTHDGPCLDVPYGRIVCSHEREDLSDHTYAEFESQATLRTHLVMEHGVSQDVATTLYNEGDHHLRTIHRVFHRQPEEGD